VKRRVIQTFVIVGALVFPCTGALWADTPELEPGIKIYDGSDPLDVGKGSVPTSVDWNNDGKKDLVVGAFTQSKNVWLFLNQGTDHEPVFNGGVNIKSNGVPIKGSWG
jgi:hypothetical protein